MTAVADWEVGFSRRSDVEFRHLLDKLPAAAYTCDADGLITYFNQRAAGLWGRAPRLRDPIDRFCGSFKLFSAEGTPIAHDECWMALALRDNRAYDGEEILIERPDGHVRTVLAHANPIHDETGAGIGAVNMLVDITDRKRAETILREADRSKDEFLALLAHELRNPLAPMQNALLAMKLGGDLPDFAEDARGRLERQLQHLTRIVDDLLDVSRIAHNTLELRLAPVELASVIRQAIETSRPTMDSADQELGVTLPTESIFLNADPIRLAQLFTNLLSNASKYTDRGGRIWLTAEQQGNDAWVTVRDTGIGIAADDVERVFEMFTRAEASVDRSQGGLGIGLTLARRIAEMHGGTVSARSEGPGQGSEFLVRLPVILPQVRTQPLTPALSAAPPDQSRRRVLVVDDYPDSADSLADLLRITGNEAHTAHDGETALAIATSLQPDVIFLDVGLPGISGYDVAREIRTQSWAGKVLLVAMTGWGQDQDRLRSREAGFDHHLVKPVEHEVLEKLLRDALPRPEGAFRQGGADGWRDAMATAEGPPSG